MEAAFDRIVEAWPVAVALVATALAWWLITWLLTRKPEYERDYEIRRQLLLTAIALVGVVAVVLTLPVDLQIRGALLGALGVTLAAMIGLSSTTLIGNALAGFMLRTVRNFRVGDFVSVEGHFGRVTYRRLLATEIQTEDRDLTTLPNLYLVTHPVKVVKASGTIVSATVSLGYDVHHLKLDPLFAEAVERAGLSDPFTYVTDLGDHSVTYRIAGFLAEVKHLLSARSALRAAIFDVLGEHGVEIVSPTFMNQRQIAADKPVLARPPRGAPDPAPETEPEEIVFHKAEAAAAIEELRTQRNEAAARLSEIDGLVGAADGAEAASLEAERIRLKVSIEQLDAELEQRASGTEED